MKLNSLLIDEIITNALREDIGTGDLTAGVVVPCEATVKGFIQAKEEGILAGIEVARQVFAKLNENIRFQTLKADGEYVSPGTVVAEIEGSARDILAGERVALNLLQRMSGIATRTKKVANLLEGTDTSIVDTRKTTPGLRVLEKYSVVVGGGKNHRFGLYDGVLIKDNHIKVAGGIKEAVTRARQGVPHTIKVEVEVESLEGVQEALEAGADIIMLDNMPSEEVRRAVELINKKALIEVSGGITEDRIIELASCGVDIISMGALTHSVKALDISLDLGQIKN